jgi:CDP-diglyceride synthetase
MASLARRLLSATALIGGVVLLLYVLPSIVSVCVLMLLAVLGMLEFYVILNHAGIPAFRVMGTIAGVCFLAV